ncbi:MAG: TFIIB-type zinc ribbon-containing protein [Bacilli bacterium]|nr:TFIIB-type zinc ribbon-containing protein [Bacilli bacterium]
MAKEVKVVNTDDNKKHGTNRCPQCGASDVTYNIKKGKLVCNYCYTEFDAEELEGIEKDVKKLKGETRTSGTKDIDENANDIVTLKCSGCGAEVVINTAEAMNARCHWCRSILSINSQIENGSLPDVVLPFKLTKEEAQTKIDGFAKKRKFFANKLFKKEFTTNNIMGVYFPYMLVDANCHGKFSGEGGEVARSYQISKGKNSKGEEEYETVYDIDMYDVQRVFDIAIDDLSIESSADKLDKNNKDKTTNVINSVMPFDTENCVKYKGNYLVGYTSEKRDINVSNIEAKVDQELQDVARYALNKDLTKYDAGVHWENEEFEIKGKQWVSAYLPVWLYSYQDPGKLLHYVAVNARTGETMGSIPMNKGRLAIISILLFLAFFIMALIFGEKDEVRGALIILGLITGLVFYIAKYSKYRNKGARHKYEIETKNKLDIISRVDNEKYTKRECSSDTIDFANNHMIYGEGTSVIPKEKKEKE